MTKQNAKKLVSRISGAITGNRGQLLPGAGRGGIHKSLKNPGAKWHRQEWRKTVNRGVYD